MNNDFLSFLFSFGILPIVYRSHSPLCFLHGYTAVADTLRRIARQPVQNKFRNLVKAINRTALECFTLETMCTEGTEKVVIFSFSAFSGARFFEVGFA